MVPTAAELDALEKSISDAAAQFGVIWISFLTFATYLVITVGSVTHRMLFEESPVKLPVLGVDLPLVGFFLVAPLLLLILHFYVLLQLLAIAEKIDRFEAWGGGGERRRNRLNHFIFVRYFFRMQGDGSLLTRLSATVIITITLILAPLAILIQTQLTFLPYHHWTTSVHRAALAVDLVLLFVFWSAIRATAKKPKHAESPQRRRALICYGFAGLGVILTVLSIFVATYPGERHHQMFLFSWLNNKLFQGKINPATGDWTGVFSNTLVLPDVDFLDDARRRDSDTPLSLRGRDLRGAILIRANLRKVDFAGANLMDARLDYAWLRAARFNCSYELEDLGKHDENRCERLHKASDGWPKDRCTWLQGASLIGARMQDAWFFGARLQRAHLTDGELEAATLECAELHKAHLEGAHLEAARLTRANFDRAVLDGAQLQGADIEGASFTNIYVKPRCVRTPRVPDAFAVMRMTSVWRTHGKAKVAIASPGEVDAKTPLFDSAYKFRKWRAEILSLLPNEASKQRAQYKLATLDPDPADEPDRSRPDISDWSQVPQSQDAPKICP